MTGGAGYIGAHTSKLLSKNGYEPVAYDDLSTGHQGFVKWGPLEKGDIHDTTKLVNVIKKYKPSAVIHFAAKAYVGESVLNPYKYYWNNVAGTLSLLSAMRMGGLNSIVFSSTCATYGVPDMDKISEKCQQKPINPYGQSKLMIEKILGDIAERNEISQISLRYFNAAGADSDCEIGEKHDPETHLIPLAIQSATSDKPLMVYGTDFSTADGTAVRDYIHVDDLAKAHVMALNKVINSQQSEYINLGTGVGTSVMSIVNNLKSLGVDVNAVEHERRLGDPACLVADASKAYEILGWTPDYKDVKEILVTAVNWHNKENKK